MTVQYVTCGTLRPLRLVVCPAKYVEVFLWILRRQEGGQAGSCREQPLQRLKQCIVIKRRLRLGGEQARVGRFGRDCFEGREGRHAGAPEGLKAYCFLVS